MGMEISGNNNGYGFDPNYSQQYAQSNYQNQGGGEQGVNLQQMLSDMQNGQMTPQEQQFMQKLLQMLKDMESGNEGSGGQSGGGGGTGGGGGGGEGVQHASQSASVQAASGIQSKAAAPVDNESTGSGSSSGASTPASSSGASTPASSSGTVTPASSTGSSSGSLPYSGEGLGISPTSANGNGQNMGDANWYSNWSMSPTSGAKGQFVPTVDNLSDASSQSQLESEFKSSGAKMALGFNEPDNAGQANISPSQAASAWGNVAGAAENTGTQLASPSVTNSTQPGQGLDWLKQFMNSDTTVNGKQEKVGDTVSAINLHWYGSASNPNDPSQASQQVSDLKSYLQQAHAEFPDKPIVLSEYGLNANGNSASSSPEFLKQAQAMLNEPDMSFVQMSAPYGLGTPSGNSTTT